MYRRDEKERPSHWRTVERRLARRDRRALRMLISVAEVQCVPVEMLFARSRSRTEVALARQLAMYLMHVALGRSVISVAKLFKRNASTVKRSCYAIEDRRDVEAFDHMVSHLEAFATTTNRKRQGARGRHHAHV